MRICIATIKFNRGRLQNTDLELVKRINLEVLRNYLHVVIASFLIYKNYTHDFYLSL